MVMSIWSQAGAAAGGLKGVWLLTKTVIIHSGRRHGDQAECARCVSGWGGGAKVNWNMTDWSVVSETGLGLFPRRLSLDPQHSSLAQH